MGQTAVNSLEPLTVDTARRLLADRPHLSAFVFSDDLVADASFHSNGTCIIVDSPAGALYAALPRCIHLYPLTDNPPVALDWIAWDRNETVFVFVPHLIKISLAGRLGTSVETYERYVRARNVHKLFRHPIQPLGAMDFRALERLYAMTGTARFSRRVFDRGTYVGLFREGELVGAYGTHFLNDRQGIAMTGFLAVHPEARGEGVGRDLVFALIDSLRARYPLIVCDIAPGNTPSIRAHLAAGFSPTGIVYQGYLCEGGIKC